MVLRRYGISRWCLSGLWVIEVGNVGCCISSVQLSSLGSALLVCINTFGQRDPAWSHAESRSGRLSWLQYLFGSCWDKGGSYITRLF